MDDCSFALWHLPEAGATAPPPLVGGCDPASCFFQRGTPSFGPWVGPAWDTAVRGPAVLVPQGVRGAPAGAGACELPTAGQAAERGTGGGERQAAVRRRREAAPGAQGAD